MWAWRGHHTTHLDIHKVSSHLTKKRISHHFLGLHHINKVHFSQSHSRQWIQWAAFVMWLAGDIYQSGPFNFENLSYDLMRFPMIDSSTNQFHSTLKTHHIQLAEVPPCYSAPTGTIFNKSLMSISPIYNL